MKTKQDAVIAWLIKITPKESSERANAFAAFVWEKNFSHIDFVSWNGEISDEVFSQVVAEANGRSAASEKDLANLMEFLGAYRKAQPSAME